MRRDLVILASDTAASRIVCNALLQKWPDALVILEPPLSKVRLFRGRARRLGWRRAIGQALFIGLAVPYLRRSSRRRMEEIREAHNLDQEILTGSIELVQSANDKRVHSLLKEADPKVVVVQGTRILSRATLGSVPAVFLNLHAGWTPTYRGSHGAYWALRDARPDLAGSTVHTVDAGIDTGPPLARVRAEITPQDNFVTYPLVQVACGIPYLIKAVEDGLEGKIQYMEPDDLPTGIHYHPTLMQYITCRLKFGVK